MQQKSVKSVLEQHTQWLMSLPGVIGTGQGELKGKPCIRVFVTEKLPGTLEKIPSDLEGYPVEVLETGEFRASGTE